MTVYTDFITKETVMGKPEFFDITEEAQFIVSKSKIKNGLATVFTPSATSAIILNENDKFLYLDLFDVLEKITPKALRTGQYHHPDPHHVDNFLNAHSHLRCSIMGQSQTIPIIDGKLLLGTYQRIIFLELEDIRKRKRKICVQVTGE